MAGERAAGVLYGRGMVEAEASKGGDGSDENDGAGGEGGASRCGQAVGIDEGALTWI